MIAPGSMVKELATFTLQLATYTPALQCVGVAIVHSSRVVVPPARLVDPPAPAKPLVPPVAALALLSPAMFAEPEEVMPAEGIAPAAPVGWPIGSELGPQPKKRAAAA